MALNICGKESVLSTMTRPPHSQLLVTCTLDFSHVDQQQEESTMLDISRSDLDSLYQREIVLPFRHK